MLVRGARDKHWTLPRGAADGGELLPVRAVRGATTDSGVAMALDWPLGVIDLEGAHGHERVHFWRATPTGGKATPESGHDRRWASAKKAHKLVKDAAERELIEAALAAPAAVPLVVTRHGKAMLRKRWAHADPLRPLTERGRHQSAEVARVLAAFGVRRVTSSSSHRCVSTMMPYATARHLPIERATILSEERGVPDPEAVAAHLRELAAATFATRTPTVVCGHRPVLPAMMAGLEQPDQPFRTGESAIFYVTADASVGAAERVRTIT